MSTRSVLAVQNGDGFKGRYAHYDGYPTSRAAQLFQTYKELFNDAELVRQYAVKPSLNGSWSSYCPPSEVAEREANKPDYQTSNYTYNEDTNNEGWIYSDGDHWGTEWAYVIGDKALSVFSWRYQDEDYTEGSWVFCGAYDWNKEHDWEKLEKAVYAGLEA